MDFKEDFMFFLACVYVLFLDFFDEFCFRSQYINVYCIRKIEKLENKQTNSSTTVRAYK